MSDIEGLFAPIPSRIPQIPQMQIPEVEVEVPKKVSIWWLPTYNMQFYSIIAVLVVGIVYLLWYTSKQTPPIAEDVVQKIKTAAATLELPTMADLDSMPKLHINSVDIKQPDIVQQPQPQTELKFTGNVSNPDNLKELGTWMRDGLALRKVAPDIITHILTFTVRSILQKSDPKPVAQVVPAPIPVAVPIVALAPPIGGRIDIRGKPIPIFQDETVDNKKEGKINAELDPRIIAMLKSRTKEDT
jgi:hypothetical protein